MNRIRRKPTPLWLRTLVCAYIFSAVLLAFSLTLICQILIYLFLFPLFLTKLRCRYIILGSVLRFWNTLFVLRLNPFWKIVVVRGPPKNYKPSKTLIVVNHTSNADPWICCSSFFPWELKYVLKYSLLRIPLLGWCCRIAGDIPIHFTKEKGGWGTVPGSVKDVMGRVKFLQDVGIGQVVFPEGTRSWNGRLKLFKDGFFRYALENTTEIFPFVIHNGWELWPVGSKFPDIGTAYIVFGNPLLPKEDDTVETLKNRVRKEMIDLLQRCPFYDPMLDAPHDEYTSVRGGGLYGYSLQDS